MENNNLFIYCVKDPITNEIRYIGQTSRGKKRFYQHIRASKYKNQPICCYIKSLISKNLKPIFEVIEYCTLDNIDDKEMYYISLYKSDKLLNLTDGGKTTRGYKMPRHIVERLKSLPKPPSYWKNKKLPEDIKLKISKSRIGKYTKDNNSFYGKKHTEVAKHKMRNNRKDIIPVKCIENNKEYVSIESAARDLNIFGETITRQLNGKQKTASGFTFERIQNVRQN